MLPSRYSVDYEAVLSDASAHGSVKLSAEHVWGEWISKLLGRRETRQEHRYNGVVKKW